MSEQLSEMANLFTGHSAWFSTSVLSKTRGLWLALGGKESSFESADFVFSSDINTPDTARIFEHPAYREHCLAIIDPLFINDCIISEDIMDVCLGDYILYPKGVQKFIEKNKHLKSNCSAKMNLTENETKKLHLNQKTEDKKKSNEEFTTPNSQEIQGAVHISDMELISGDLEDFIPGKNKCLVYHL